jgi:alkylated DNA repair dioxygenase AlkB
MNLNKQEINSAYNLLPKNGTVNYYGKLFSAEDADHYLAILLNNIEWKNDEAVIFGRHIITKRKVAWYGDHNFPYTYSKRTRYALLWTSELLLLKKIIEQHSGEQFNSCLLNLYHNGEEGMAWHSDDEKELKENGAIASLSFGAERRFAFRHKQTKDTINLHLENGSLLIMKDETQTHWLHHLPKAANVAKPRVNLTFRMMMQKDL